MIQSSLHDSRIFRNIRGPGVYDVAGIIIDRSSPLWLKLRDLIRRALSVAQEARLGNGRNATSRGETERERSKERKEWWL